MDGRIDLWNPFLIDPRDQNMNSPEYSNGESPPPAMFSGQKKSSAPSPKRSSKRGIEKRVVSIPIKEVEGSRVKGESNTAPPSDTWAWRKYGQKPIKGSPYPRGYYRCSSSKGCPARKQVERSSVDPSMLVITYSSEHNHPWPASRNHHHHHHHSSPSTSDKPSQTVSLSDPPEPDRGDNKFTDAPADDSLITDGLGWVGEWDIESVSPTLFQSPVSTGSCVANDADLAMFFPVAMGEEADDSLFADLGELPECSVVFRRELVGRAPAAWCGTTS